MANLNNPQGEPWDTYADTAKNLADSQQYSQKITDALMEVFADPYNKMKNINVEGKDITNTDLQKEIDGKIDLCDKGILGPMSAAVKLTYLHGRDQNQQ